MPHLASSDPSLPQQLNSLFTRLICSVGVSSNLIVFCPYSWCLSNTSHALTDYYQHLEQGEAQKRFLSFSFPFVLFIQYTNWQRSDCLIRMAHLNRYISIVDLQLRGLQFTSSKTPQKSGGGMAIWPRTCELYITLLHCQSKPQLYNTLEHLHIKTRFHKDKMAELNSLTHSLTHKKLMYSKVIVLTHPPS
jgi:hypothetical protein